MRYRDGRLARPGPARTPRPARDGARDSAMRSPGASPGQRRRKIDAGRQGIVEFRRRHPHLYLAAVLSEPAPGHAYQLWLGERGVTPVGRCSGRTTGSRSSRSRTSTSQFDEASPGGGRFDLRSRTPTVPAGSPRSPSERRFRHPAGAAHRRFARTPERRTRPSNATTRPTPAPVAPSCRTSCRRPRRARSAIRPTTTSAPRARY